MEPKASMSAFAVITLIAVVLLALQGDAAVATGLAAGIAAFAALLDLSYRVRSRGRRCLVLAPRRTLDRIVRAQWAGVLVVGCVLAQILDATGVHPISDDSEAVRALIVAFAIGITTIYASSLV